MQAYATIQNIISRSVDCRYSVEGFFLMRASLIHDARNLEKKHYILNILCSRTEQTIDVLNVFCYM